MVIRVVFAPKASMIATPLASAPETFLRAGLLGPRPVLDGRQGLCIDKAFN